LAKLEKIHQESIKSLVELRRKDIEDERRRYEQDRNEQLRRDELRQAEKQKKIS